MLQLALLRLQALRASGSYHLSTMRTEDYNAEKFRELIVYIAERVRNEDDFGDTKLNKALYFSDFLAYSHLGHPLTGARYQKLPWGPAARYLLPVRRELEAEGAVRVESRPVAGKEATVTVALRPANVELFAEEELEIVDQVVDAIRKHTAVSVSAMSHRESPGWNLVDLRDDIPYSTALVSNESPSPTTVDAARDALAKLGW